MPFGSVAKQGGKVGLSPGAAVRGAPRGPPWCWPAVGEVKPAPSPGRHVSSCFGSWIRGWIHDGEGPRHPPLSPPAHPEPLPSWGLGAVSGVHAGEGLASVSPLSRWCAPPCPWPCGLRVCLLPRLLTLEGQREPCPQGLRMPELGGCGPASILLTLGPSALVLGFLGTQGLGPS